MPQWVLRPFWAHECSKPGARYDRRCFSESCLSESCLTEATCGISLRIRPSPAPVMPSTVANRPTSTFWEWFVRNSPVDPQPLEFESSAVHRRVIISCRDFERGFISSVVLNIIANPFQQRLAKILDGALVYISSDIGAVRRLLACNRVCAYESTFVKWG